MSRRQFYAPNSKQNVLKGRQAAICQRAIEAAALHGGLINGIHLAGILGVSPRGLRQTLFAIDELRMLFTLEIREGNQHEGQNWYRLNLKAAPKQAKPPKLICIKTPPPPRLTGSEIRRLSLAKPIDDDDNCAPVTKPIRVR